MIRKNKLRIGLSILILLVIATTYYCFTLDESNNAKVIISEGYPDGISKEEMEEAMQREADKNYWSFDINANPVFKTGKSEGFLRIVNPPYNLYDIEVDIRLQKNNEILFQTGRLQPNHYVGYGKLKSTLPKGTHKAKVEIRAYEKNSNKMFNKAYADIEIEIEN